MREPAAVLLDEQVVAVAPVSPVARRAPGHGAWGHEPLLGARVRLLAMTPSRLVVLSLDRDVGGPLLYRVTQVEIAASRDAVRGVRLGPRRPSRRFVVELRDGSTWRLEVSAAGRRRWGPIADALGVLDPRAGMAAPGDAATVERDARA